MSISARQMRTTSPHQHHHTDAHHLPEPSPSHSGAPPPHTITIAQGRHTGRLLGGCVGRHPPAQVALDDVHPARPRLRGGTEQQPVGAPCIPAPAPTIKVTVVGSCDECIAACPLLPPACPLVPPGCLFAECWKHLRRDRRSHGRAHHTSTSHTSTSRMGTATFLTRASRSLFESSKAQMRVLTNACERNA